MAAVLYPVFKKLVRTMYCTMCRARVERAFAWRLLYLSSNSLRHQL